MAFIGNKLGLNMALPENNRWLFIPHPFPKGFKKSDESTVLNKYPLLCLNLVAYFHDKW
jgi:hypothetical protein